MEKYTTRQIVFDDHPNLIAFQNGTYDAKRCIFRRHARKDYLSQIMSYALPTVSNKNIRCEILQFYADILLDETVRAFVLLYFALHLLGVNKLVVIFTGARGAIVDYQ